MNISSPRPVLARIRPDLVVNIIGLLAAFGVAAWLADKLTAGREFDALAAVVLMAVVVAILARPRFGFLLWITVAPFARIFTLKMGDGLPDLGLNRLAILCALFVIIAQVAVGRRRLARPTAVDWLAVLFVLSMVLSVPASRLGSGRRRAVFVRLHYPSAARLFLRPPTAAGAAGRPAGRDRPWRLSAHCLASSWCVSN